MNKIILKITFDEESQRLLIFSKYASCYRELEALLKLEYTYDGWNYKNELEWRLEHAPQGLTFLNRMMKYE